MYWAFSQSIPCNRITLAPWVVHKSNFRDKRSIQNMIRFNIWFNTVPVAACNVELLNDHIHGFNHMHKVAVILVKSTVATGAMLRGYYNGQMELKHPLSICRDCPNIWPLWQKKLIQTDSKFVNHLEIWPLWHPRNYLAFTKPLLPIGLPG
jgi:hypothetical protein